jgi:casein kinase 1
MNKYALIEEIGGGAFGTVYKGKNKRTNEEVAIKMEPVENEVKLLKNETKIYILLQKEDGFLKIRWYGMYKGYYCMVMEMLGNSLEDFKQDILIKKPISKKDLYNLGIQMMKRIQSLHNIGIIHRDIKPENFLFGSKESNIATIHLIDFGLAKTFAIPIEDDDEVVGNDETEKNEKIKEETSKTHKHIPFKINKNIIGTPNFISLNVHDRKEPSRRDDIISIIYILIYLFLPRWVNKNVKEFEIVYYKKELMNNSIVPIELKYILDYLYKLNFEERPDYDLIFNYLFV